jgi:uncharacterized membrane protein (UPF0127 family)
MKLKICKLILIFSFAACASVKGFEYEKRDIFIGDQQLKVEIADTTEKRIRGLQFREKLGKNEGMLFVYNEEQFQSFWMKDTPIPLDLAYINRQGKINEIYSLNPHETTVYRSREKAQYVLEVNQGWFKDNEIGVGTIVKNLPAYVITEK